MSYLSVLQLEREPFSTSPDPDFFYRSAEHAQTLERLEIAIRLRRGLSVVLADVGMGKTTLSRALLRAFQDEEEDFIFYMMLDPGFKLEEQFLTHLIKLFGIPLAYYSPGTYRQAIEAYLFQKCVEEDKTVVLIVDEGQKLTSANLELLRTLLNYETNQYKLLQLVIFGQLELLLRLQGIPNLMDRISVKCVLHPLDENQTQELIAFRLRQACPDLPGEKPRAVGGTGYIEGSALFSPEAIRKIYQHTQGYPRRITRICHLAMEYLIMEDQRQVTKTLIDKIIAQEESW